VGLILPLPESPFRRAIFLELWWGDGNQPGLRDYIYNKRLRNAETYDVRIYLRIIKIRKSVELLQNSRVIPPPPLRKGGG
jgi:hypothetical protein